MTQQAATLWNTNECTLIYSAIIYCIKTPIGINWTRTCHRQFWSAASESSSNET